jgi:hypothetical protein
MSALPPKADIAERRWHVRFVPAPTSEHEIWLRDPFRSIEVQVDEPALPGVVLIHRLSFPVGALGPKWRSVAPVVATSFSSIWIWVAHRDRREEGHRHRLR